jgi:hypothetical protein
MGRRSAATEPVGKPFPRWAILLGGFGVAALAYVGARGGPENTIQEIAEWTGHVKPPHIVSLQPTMANTRVFRLSIENPSLRRIQITGYRAEPSLQEAAALSVTKAEEDKPQACRRSRTIRLRTPLVIAAKSEEGLDIEPWLDECDFSVHVTGTTGSSDPAFWIPRTIDSLKGMVRSDPSTYRLVLTNAKPALIDHLKDNGLPDPKTLPLPASSPAR